MTCLAVDLGGTDIKLGLVAEGKVLRRTTLKVVPGLGLGGHLGTIASGLKDLRAGLKTGACKGVAFGFPGLVDSDADRVLSTNEKFDDAVGLDLRAWAREKLGLELVLENDARLALLGEARWGAARTVGNVVLVTMGTGIGSAVLMDGRLLKGKHFQAGNLGGHMSLQMQGRRCGCGNVGCMEAEASTWALQARLREHPGLASSGFSDAETLDYKLLFQLAAQGDALALEELERSLEIWSAGVINLVTAYDPELVLFSGGLMHSSERILPFIIQRIEERAWTPWGKPALALAEHPQSAALLGGEALLAQRSLA